MSALRKDPCTGRWVVLEDPWQVRPVGTGACPFCAGNESLTPPEIAVWAPPGRSPNLPGWEVRVVANLRPALRIEEPLTRRAERMYDAASGTGAHEIVIETPEHEDRLSQLSRGRIALVLAAWAARIADLKRDLRIRAVFVFKNQGVMAGATLPSHSHSQIIGLPVTPKALKEILDGARSHFRLKERCVFCDILREELEDGRRVIATSEYFVAIAPFASRHPFECWILPREHSPDFETADSNVLLDLAGLLKMLLRSLEATLPEPAFNLFLYSGPNRDSRPGYWTTLDQDFHWHIAVLPRPAQVAGFEVGTGFYSNPVSPEAATAELRTSLKAMVEGGAGS